MAGPPLLERTTVLLLLREKLGVARSGVRPPSCSMPPVRRRRGAVYQLCTKASHAGREFTWCTRPLICSRCRWLLLPVTLLLFIRLGLERTSSVALEGRLLLCASASSPLSRVCVCVCVVTRPPPGARRQLQSRCLGRKQNHFA